MGIYRYGITPSSREAEKKLEGKRKKHFRPECTCATEDFCHVHPTDTESLDPNGPWGPP